MHTQEALILETGENLAKLRWQCMVKSFRDEFLVDQEAERS